MKMPYLCKYTIVVSVLLITLIASVSGLLTMPVHAHDYPQPPFNPDQSWQPPDDDILYMNPTVAIEAYDYRWSHLELTPPVSVANNGSIINACLVNSNGRAFTNLYRNDSCYLIVSIDSPGYLYLWEYYPSGNSPLGHWLYYRWHCPGAGVWKLGPFAADMSDPPGYYTWKMWFLSGTSWSTRTVHFNYTRSYSPPDIPVLITKQSYKPVINFFGTNKPSLEIGDTAMLSWSTTYATGVTITPNIGSVAASGNTSITPLKTTTYILKARDSSGNTVSSTITIVVSPRPVPIITASKTSIKKGESVYLSWNAPGALTVVISVIGETDKVGSQYIKPRQTTVYNLSAQYADGTKQSSSVTITVKKESGLLWILLALFLLGIAAISLFLLKRRGEQETKSQSPDDPSCWLIKDSDVKTTGSSNVLPKTTPVIDASAAKLTITGGGEFRLIGNSRALGRMDFEKFMPTDEAAYISRHHVTVWFEDNRYYIEDRSSTNGTEVNGNEIKNSGRRQLSEGDVIKIAGKIDMVFHQESLEL